MKIQIPLLALFSLLAAPSFAIEPAPPGQTTQQTTTTQSTSGPVTTTTTRIAASDDLAVGDPLGNRAMSARSDAGPSQTHAYCEDGSTAEHCVRATRRHTAPTTWQQDCATGLSKSCGFH